MSSLKYIIDFDMKGLPKVKDMTNTLKELNEEAKGLKKIKAEIEVDTDAKKLTSVAKSLKIIEQFNIKDVDFKVEAKVGKSFEELDEVIQKLNKKFYFKIFMNKKFMSELRMLEKVIKELRKKFTFNLQLNGGAAAELQQIIDYLDGIQNQNVNVNAGGNAKKTIQEIIDELDKIKDVSLKVGAVGTGAAVGTAAAASGFYETTKESQFDFAKLRTNSAMKGVSFEDEVVDSLKKFAAISDDSHKFSEVASLMLSGGHYEDKGDDGAWLKKLEDSIAGIKVKYNDAVSEESLVESINIALSTGNLESGLVDMIEFNPEIYAEYDGQEIQDIVAMYQKSLEEATSETERFAIINDMIDVSGIESAGQSYLAMNQHLVDAGNATVELQLAKEQLGAALTPFIIQLTEIITKITEWINSNENAVDGLGAFTIIASVVGFLGLFISTVIKVIMAVKTFIDWIKKFKWVGQIIMWVARIASLSFGWVIAIIAAVIAIIIYWKTIWEALKLVVMIFVLKFVAEFGFLLDIVTLALKAIDKLADAFNKVFGTDIKLDKQVDSLEKFTKKVKDVRNELAKEVGKQAVKTGEQAIEDSKAIADKFTKKDNGEEKAMFDMENETVVTNTISDMNGTNTVNYDDLSIIGDSDMPKPTPGHAGLDKYIHNSEEAEAERKKLEEEREKAKKEEEERLKKEEAAREKARKEAEEREKAKQKAQEEYLKEQQKILDDLQKGFESAFKGFFGSVKSFDRIIKEQKNGKTGLYNAKKDAETTKEFAKMYNSLLYDKNIGQHLREYIIDSLSSVDNYGEIKMLYDYNKGEKQEISSHYEEMAKYSSSMAYNSEVVRIGNVNVLADSDAGKAAKKLKDTLYY